MEKRKVFQKEVKIKNKNLSKLKTTFRSQKKIENRRQNRKEDIKINVNKINVNKRRDNKINVNKINDNKRINNKKSNKRIDNKSHNKGDFSLLPIFLVVLIDMIGIGIIIPIVGPLFLNSNLIFSEGVSLGFRTIMLGLMLAIYPFGQFFGAPIFGALSDKYGRKKLLIISLFGTFIGYVLFGIGIITHNLPLLFISRLIDGFTGGNVSIAMSSIADVSDDKQKVKRFGLVGMAFGLGIIIGPFLGGKLSDASLVSWFNYATPIWFAAVLCLINIVLFFVQFKETLKESRHSKVSLLTGLRNVHRAFRHDDFKNLRIVFLFVLLLSFGFSFYTQFFQVVLIEKYNYTSVQIGNFFGFLGVCIALSQGFIVGPVSKRFSPDKIMKIAVLPLSIVIALQLFPKTDLGIYLLVPFIALFNGLTLPNMTALVSNLTPSDRQGEILGINQSLQAIGMTIPPLLAGFIAAVHYSLPIIVGAGLIFLSWLVFVLFFHRSQRHASLKAYKK